MKENPKKNYNVGGISIFSRPALAIFRDWWPKAKTEKCFDERFEQLIGVIERAICECDDAPLQGLFSLIDSPKPTIVLNVGQEDLTLHPRLVFLYDYWCTQRYSSELPQSSTIDAVKLVPALGYLMLLEPVKYGEDFLYRVYGSEIAKQSGIEMTNRRVRDIPAPHVAVYFLATYRAAMRLKQPIYARHSTHASIQTTQWDRLILPFINRDGAVDRLLVGNIPRPRNLTARRD